MRGSRNNTRRVLEQTLTTIPGASRDLIKEQIQQSERTLTKWRKGSGGCWSRVDAVPFTIQSIKDIQEVKERQKADPKKGFWQHMDDVGREQIERERQEKFRHLLGLTMSEGV